MTQDITAPAAKPVADDDEDDDDDEEDEVEELVGEPLDDDGKKAAQNKNKGRSRE